MYSTVGEISLRCIVQALYLFYSKGLRNAMVEEGDKSSWGAGSWHCKLGFGK